MDIAEEVGGEPFDFAQESLVVAGEAAKAPAMHRIVGSPRRGRGVGSR